MNRRTLRNVVSGLGLVTLAACVVNISFEMKKSITVQSAAATPNAVTQTVDVNLLDYPDVAAHRDNIKSLDLDSATVVVASIGPANHATKVSGSIVLHKTAGDTGPGVAVGTLTNFPITVGSTVTLKGTPELDRFLLDALQGDGKFVAVVSGQTDGAADLVLDVTFHASVGYDAGIL